MSKDTISRITDRIVEDTVAWQNCPQLSQHPDVDFVSLNLGLGDHPTVHVTAFLINAEFEVLARKAGMMT